MYEDGAGRKVKRLDRLVDIIRKRGAEGLSVDWLKIVAERRIGLSPRRVKSYLKLLQRTREIREDKGKVYIREKE